MDHRKTIAKYRYVAEEARRGLPDGKAQVAGLQEDTDMLLGEIQRQIGEIEQLLAGDPELRNAKMMHELLRSLKGFKVHTEDQLGASIDAVQATVDEEQQLAEYFDATADAMQDLIDDFDRLAEGPDRAKS